MTFEIDIIVTSDDWDGVDDLDPLTRRCIVASVVESGVRLIDGCELSVTFYGVRGSTPCCSPSVNRYGGNTSTVVIEAPGELPLLLDLGTGAARFDPNVGDHHHLAGLHAGLAVTHAVIQQHAVPGIELPAHALLGEQGHVVDHHGARWRAGAVMPIRPTVQPPSSRPTGDPSSWTTGTRRNCCNSAPTTNSASATADSSEA